MVRWYVVEDMLPLNTGDSPSFCDNINKITTTISAVLPHITSISSYLEREYAEIERNLKGLHY